ncbi:leucine-rich repeat domain-containing protein [Candidatus Dependentiae bacterium]|nr:leucine-rich repeat domain-containing protein [Candidatus Dependentiae bacterium]
MMNRILRFLYVFTSFIFIAQASLQAVVIQTAGGVQIADVGEPVARLWTGLIQDLYPAPAVAPAVLPAALVFPGAPVALGAGGTGVDYAPIDSVNHPAAIILAELQTLHLLPQNQNLFVHAARNEAAIIHQISTVNRFAPKGMPQQFNVNNLKAHPKKKYYEIEITQDNINPQDIYPYLRAAFDFGFAAPIKSGLARLYAQAMLATMREMNDDEDAIDFLRASDVSQMNQAKIQDFIGLDEADAHESAIKNEIKRQYLYLYGRWIDGKGINVVQHGLLDDNVCNEVEWLTKVTLIPPVIATPIAPVKTVAQLAQEFFNYFSSWKTYFKKQIIPGIFGGISNPLWQTTLWVNFLPEVLRKEIEKLHVVRYDKCLSAQRIENLGVNDLVYLRDNGRVPHFTHIPGTTTLRSIAKEWVENFALPSLGSYFAQKQWCIVDQNNQLASWLAMLPTNLVQDICRYYHCAVIKQHGKWVEVEHLHAGNDCGDLPISYLIDYGILPLPDGVTQQNFEAENLDAQARRYANSFVSLSKTGHKKKIINQITYMSPSFIAQVCRQYMLVTARCGELLQDEAVFKTIYDDKNNHENLQITLAEALISDDVKTKITREILRDQTLDLSNMFLSQVTTADLTTITALLGVQLGNITQLNLSHNRLEQFPADLINRLPNLEVLDLSHNLLQTLPVGLFAAGANTRLKKIDLSNNQLRELPLALFRELHANPVIDSINLSHNQLNADYVPYCGSLKLKSLNLSNNGLMHLHPTLFSHTATNIAAPPATAPDQTFRNTIQELNLSGNQLTITHDNNTKQALASLAGGTIKLLDLRNNSIDKVHPIVRCQMNSLEHLLLDHNSIIEIKHNCAWGVIPNMDNLVTLSLSNNHLDRIYSDDCTWFPNLKRLDLSNNRIQTIEDDPAPLSGSALSCLSKLEVLFLDRNQLENLTKKTLKGLAKLKILHLEGNKIVDFIANIFQDLHDLEELYAYANSPTFSFDDQPGIPDTTIDANAFTGLGKLHCLDLSFNRIKTLDDEVLSALHRLTNLNLSHNKLDKLSSKLLSHLFDLNYLDVSENRLTNVEAQAFDHLRDCKVIRFKGNNASGFFKLFSHRRLMSQERTTWLGGGGSKLDIEALNRYIGIADLARLWRALGRNKALGIPGLKYLFKLIMAKKAEVTNRSVKPLKHPDSQVTLANIVQSFRDQDTELKKIAFDLGQIKVNEEAA